MSSVVGKYDIIRRIAVGGMAEIFLARQIGLEGFDRLVILKTLLPDLAQEEESVRSFLDEARIAATLNHPNIVGIYEVGVQDGLHFIAMEYISGETISGLLVAAHKSEHKISPLVSARIIRDAAAGLAHAHEATTVEGVPLGIIHRDISPQNIMVREDGVAKVVDFGIARAANRLAKTSTGAVKGKVAYMAPEQLVGQELSARTDQYALGVVLWEMLTQRRRIERSDDPMRVINTVVHEDIPPPGDFRRGLPPELDAIVQRMAARDPEERYPDCHSVAFALGEVIESHAESTRETDVAAVLRTLAGETVKARKENLTPTGQTFFLESSKTKLPPEALSGANPLENEATPKRPRLVASLAFFAVIVAAVLGWYTAQTAERQVLAAEPVADAGTPTVAVATPKSATLQIVTTPAGATVRSGSMVLGTTPLETSQLAPDARHVLEIGKKGFVAQSVTVDVTEGPQDPVEIQLAPVPPPVRSRAKSRTNPTSQASADSKKEGFLTLETVPWTKVSIDGKPYGLTTLVRVKLAPGKHTLHMTNAAAGVNAKRVVEIAPGKTRKMKIDLR
ncbi:MAG: serine/threonine-protein kinase [Myxococcota bacterium]